MRGSRPLPPGVLFVANLLVLVCAIAGFQLRGWDQTATTTTGILCTLLVILGAVELYRWNLHR